MDLKDSKFYVVISSASNPADSGLVSLRITVKMNLTNEFYGYFSGRITSINLIRLFG